MFWRDDSISIRQKALRIAVCVLCHTASPSPHTNSVNQKGGRVYIRRGHGFLIVISRLLERVSLRNACIQPGRQCLRWCVHDLFIFLWFCFSLLCSFALTANVRLLFIKKKQIHVRQTFNWSKLLCVWGSRDMMAFAPFPSILNLSVSSKLRVTRVRCVCVIAFIC